MTRERHASGQFSTERRIDRIRGAINLLPPLLRHFLRDAIRFGEARVGDFVDAFEHATGRHDPLMPPRRMIYVGSSSVTRSDYQAIGRELVDLAVCLGGLQPHHNVLEVGSGTGRIAATLTSFLAPQARFEGFDIVSAAVEWCQRHITPRFPNFQFLHADIFNTFYNPKGTHTASTFRFPYDDSTFDFAIATSVLTHMYRADSAHYLTETSRVLKRGGRTFITHFLSTPESQSAVVAGRALMSFHIPVADGFTIDATQPESAIAVDVRCVRSDYEQAGLMMENIVYGRWAGNAGVPHFQDIVIARKP